MKNFYHQVPPNSPIRKSIIKSLFKDQNSIQISSYLNIDKSSINKSLKNINSEDTKVEDLKHYLVELGKSRNRLKTKLNSLLSWFINRCGVPSGRHKRYFVRGTPLSMYIEYKLNCIEAGVDFVSFKIFHQIRKRERVGIIKGDIFQNPLIRKKNNYSNQLKVLVEKKKLNNKEVIEKKELKERIIEIEKKLEFNKERKQKYQDAHLKLEKDSTTAVITLDFFGTGKTSTSEGKEDGDFIDLILVIATKDKLNIPNTLIESQVKEITPLSSLPLETSEVILHKDDQPQQLTPRTKKSSPIKSFQKKQEVMKKKKLLPECDIADADRYVPQLSYFHFISKKKVNNETVTQTHDFLMFVFDFLFLQHKLLSNFNNFRMWSDGCGKHFKTYPTHYYISTLQKQLRNSITWNFLPPNDAHNRADGQAGAFANIIRRYNKS